MIQGPTPWVCGSQRSSPTQVTNESYSFQLTSSLDFGCALFLFSRCRCLFWQSSPVSSASLAFCLFLSTLLSSSSATASASKDSGVYLDSRRSDSLTLECLSIAFVCGFCLPSTSEILFEAHRESGNTPLENSPSSASP